MPRADLHQDLTALCEGLVVQGNDEDGRVRVFRADRDVAQLDRADRFEEAGRALCLRCVNRAKSPAIIPGDLARIAANDFPFSVDEAVRVGDGRLCRVRPIDDLDRANEKRQRVDGLCEMRLFGPVAEVAIGVILLVLDNDRRTTAPRAPCRFDARRRQAGRPRCRLAGT